MKKAFFQHVAASGRLFKTLSPSDGIDLMISFYQKERVEGCAFDQDGDMLLYQWGAYDWGEGKTFELDITRQLIEEGGEDEDIWQLSLSFEFKPTAMLDQIGQGNCWCNTPDQLEAFREFITRSATFTQLAKATPKKVRLDFEIAG